MAPLTLLLAMAAFAGTDIRSVEGGVAVFLPAIEDWRPVSKVPFGLRPGDRVRLKPLAKANLSFADGTTLRFSQEATFRIEKDDERGTGIAIESGRVDASVPTQDRLVEVKAPGSLVTLQGEDASVTIGAKKVVIVEVARGL